LVVPAFFFVGQSLSACDPGELIVLGTDGGLDATPPNDADVGEPPHSPLGTNTKVDVLFVVDNSSSMFAKQDVLARTVPRFIRRLIAPRCVTKADPACVAAGASCPPADVSKPSGQECPSGTAPEFPPVRDLHVGVISSSLGAMGGAAAFSAPGTDPDLYRKAYDVCPSADPGNPTKNDRAHLLTRDPSGGTVAGADAHGVFAWSGAQSDSTAFIDSVQKAIRGVGSVGCAVEAQLESAYKFLMMPDPWQQIGLQGPNINAARAVYEGLDEQLLAQRNAFLRPDSTVAVVLLTDEDDSSADPLAIAGQAWNFQASSFSPYTDDVRRQRTTTGVPTYTAPRGTSACETEPASAACTSCAYGTSLSDPACQINGGYLTPAEDDMNVRFFDMKRRFGVDPQYPLSRYVAGFRAAKIPGRDDEHDPSGRYVGTPRCTNPLYAAVTYPSREAASAVGRDLCNLPQGSRKPGDVYFMVLGGVGNHLLYDTNASNHAVPKANLPWAQIVGRDPARYDRRDIDPHMLPSTAPRAGLAAPAVRGDNGSDPVHGREWTTNGTDLQFACTFALKKTHTTQGSNAESPNSDGTAGFYCGPAAMGAPPRASDVPVVSLSQCECNTFVDDVPLCDPADGTRQIRAAARPSLRELTLARDLGDQAVVGSVCPISDVAADDKSQYGVAFEQLVDRLRTGCRKASCEAL